MSYKQTKILRTVFVQGHSETQRYGSDILTMDYLLLAILKQEKGHAAFLLKKLLRTWEIYQIRSRIETELKRMKESREELAVEAGYSDENILQRLACGLTQGAEPILNTAHLLMAIVRDKNSVCGQALAQYDITSEKLEEFVRELPLDEDYYEEMQQLDEMSADRDAELLFSPRPATLPGLPARSTTPKRDEGKSMLERCGTDLTQAAREGKFDPVIGREGEIERLIHILGRRKKNNPVLIGEPGVGKSAIVEGLAQCIVQNSVPYSLRNKRLYAVDVAALVAGTKYRGEFEERMQLLIEEVNRQGEVILFIDELHTIVGAGSTQGSLDTANILKPMLARGELRCIGATTLREYHESIETDGALERRFQKIMIEPPTSTQTLQVLRHLKGRYEQYHGVRYSDKALQACVSLTQRYLPDRFFPDKAIDVMDEAGSLGQFSGEKIPQEILCVEQKIEQISHEKRRAIAHHSSEYLSVLQDCEVDMRAELQLLQNDWQRVRSKTPVLVDESHVQQVLSSMTGIPLVRMSQGEQGRMKGLYDHFRSVVIGQDVAVHKVVRALHRSRVGLKDPNRPIGVFLFVGPTGVGKTLLAKELAHRMFDGEEAFIRLDMSEFSEKHTASRLVGAPPGYVGYGEGGQLTERVRRHPYSIVLFDEIEKAHSDIFNLMLQIFDEGELTDGTGRKVDFRNTIIILTSNVGSREVQQRSDPVGYAAAQQEQRKEVERESLYRKALESTFAPEFINRIDDVVLFNRLEEREITRIVELEIARMVQRMQTLGYGLRISAQARRYLVHEGYQPRYGVRSLKRTILDEIEAPMAEWIVEGKIKPGGGVRVECRDGRLGLRCDTRFVLHET